MRIANRQIGDSAPVYIIAELGVNHDGSVARAVELVTSAAASGADAVKLQLFRTDLLMSRVAKLAAYQKSAGESDPVSMLRRLELSIDQMGPLVRRAHELGMHAIVTVFSTDLVREAEQLPWDAYKTASPDIIHKPLLESLAVTGRPLILSTGAAEFDEVARAVEWLAPYQRNLSLLQCVSSYPTPPQDASIGGMFALRELCSRVGYSDHTREVDTGDLAADAGACILEKHFTYDKTAPGPDHAASLEPHEFKRYAELARDASTLRIRIGAEGPIRQNDPRLGPRQKQVLPCEQDVRLVSRQSLVTRVALKAGDAIRREHLTVKRPGTGIPPCRLEEAINKRLSRPLEADTPVCDSDLL